MPATDPAAEHAQAPDATITLADQQWAAHHYITQAEDLARLLRLVTGGRLTLAVVDNHGRELRQRTGMTWHDAHLAAAAALAAPDGQQARDCPPR